MVLSRLYSTMDLLLNEGYFYPTYRPVDYEDPRLIEGKAEEGNPETGLIKREAQYIDFEGYSFNNTNNQKLYTLVLKNVYSKEEHCEILTVRSYEEEGQQRVGYSAMNNDRLLKRLSSLRNVDSRILEDLILLRTLSSTNKSGVLNFGLDYEPPELKEFIAKTMGLELRN